MKGIPEGSQVWMSHGDSILELPDGFELIAKIDSIPVAAYASLSDKYNQMVCCVPHLK
jgi:GMP synthase (glutamine-hydrolysing)